MPAPLIDAPTLERCPHEVWEWLREQRPVCEAPALGLTLVTRHDDVERVSRDEQTFSSHVPDSPLGRTVGPNMLHMQGGAHAAQRELIAPILRARVMRDNHAGPLIAEARAIVAAHPEHLDAVTEYARPLAELFIERLVGFQPQEHGTLERWFRGIAQAASNFEQDPAKAALGQSVSDELSEAIDSALSAGVTPPGSLLRRYAETGTASDREILAMVALFIIGGLQEPRDLLGLTIAALMQHPDQLAAVLAQPMLLARTVEETARWESPVGTINRITTTDVELSGTMIPAGVMVGGVLASANRDPRRWTRPHEFRIDRDEGPHLAFAVGAHACIGAAAARLFVCELLECLLPSLAGASLQATPEVRGYEFRGPVSVPLSFEIA